MKRKYPKRHSSWIDVTFSIIIVTLTVSAIYLFSLTTKNEAATLPENKLAAKPTEVIIDTIDFHYAGIKISTETSNDLYKPYAIQYPQSFHSTFNNDISQYIKKAKQNYLTTDELDSLEQELVTIESDSESKRVALTFDDGPDPKVTIQILDTLDKYNAKATFFMLGSQVECYPEIAKKVQEAGHELGNHTWKHPDLTNTGVEKARNEIIRTSSIIEDVTGQKATVFRPPYGSINKSVRNQTDLPVILWDIDTLDWKHRNSNLLLTHIKGQTRDRSIILMHDIHQSTADGLDAVLAYLKSEGYIFVKTSEL